MSTSNTKMYKILINADGGVYALSLGTVDTLPNGREGVILGLRLAIAKR